jgi:uncharacterized iron-regulated membrane protein
MKTLFARFSKLFFAVRERGNNIWAVIGYIALILPFIAVGYEIARVDWPAAAVYAVIMLLFIGVVWSAFQVPAIQASSADTTSQTPQPQMAAPEATSGPQETSHTSSAHAVATPMETQSTNAQPQVEQPKPSAAPNAPANKGPANAPRAGKQKPRRTS